MSQKRRRSKKYPISFGVNIYGNWYGTTATSAKQAVGNVVHREFTVPANRAAGNGRAKAAEIKEQAYALEGVVTDWQFFPAKTPRLAAA